MGKKAELRKTIKEIIDLPENAEAKVNFERITGQYNYKSCDTRIGWRSGKTIEFVVKFTKNGTDDALTSIINGFTDISEPLYFIYGLNPKIFHFNPLFKSDEENTLSLSFKLLPNG